VPTPQDPSMDVSQLISGQQPGAPQVDIAPGERVRSYDFGGIRTCYAEGIVEVITEPMEGCRRYKLRVETCVFDGQSVALEEPYVYPPVNGTPTTFGGVTNGVERVTELGNSAQ
jgi:hypothetical protein